MAHPSPQEVTQLLLAWSEGDKTALDKLIPVVYEELHRRARHYMANERPGHTLQPTALVNEAYLRLADYRRMKWTDRAHFFAVCAQLMRRILVDHARRRQYQKRGGRNPPVSLDEAVLIPGEMNAYLVSLDDALTALTRIDGRKGRIVELKFFGGLNIKETAEVLKVSASTVEREWKRAKAWLYRDLSNHEHREA